MLRRLRGAGLRQIHEEARFIAQLRVDAPLRARGAARGARPSAHWLTCVRQRRQLSYVTRHARGFAGPRPWRSEETLLKVEGWAVKLKYQASKNHR